MLSTKGRGRWISTEWQPSWLHIIIPGCYKFGLLWRTLLMRTWSEVTDERNTGRSSDTRDRRLPYLIGKGVC